MLATQDDKLPIYGFIAVTLAISLAVLLGEGSGLEWLVAQSNW